MTPDRSSGYPPAHGLPSLSRTARHLRRYREVAEVLARHGFGALVGAIGLSHLLPRHLRGVEVPEGRIVPVHIRQALEELGPTFVKFGQVLSLRADLLPPEYVEELSRLQDQVPPGPFEQSRKLMEQELGPHLERLFSSIDPVPLASASLGQVYSATLPGGEPVVIKVLRPGVEQQVATDLEILEAVASRVKERFGAALPVDPVALVHEFGRIIRRELDFRVEARHIQRFRRNFRGDRRIHIPHVYARLSTSRVLTMERLFGTKITDVAALEELGIDRRRLARNGARLFLKMVMVDRFFHGDPHPGNLLVEADGRLGVLDYGMAGTLSPEMADHLVATFIAVARRDAAGAVRNMVRMGIVPAGVDREELRRDMQDLIERNYNRPLSELRLKEVVEDSLELVRRHRLTLPADLLLLARALVLLDGLGRSLDPSFNPLEVVVPFARRLWLRRLDPSVTLRRWLSRTEEAFEFVSALPARADRFLGELESGRFTMGVRLVETESQVRRLERSVNRLALALSAAGLAVAGGLLWLARAGPELAGIPAAALAAFVAAGAAGVGLMWGILRSGRL